MRNYFNLFFIFSLGIQLFSCQTNSQKIPKIFIQTNLDSLRIDERIACRIAFKDELNTFEFQNKKAKIRYRGNTSFFYPKKHFSLKFQEKVSLINLPARKTWILDASYIDKTFLRNKISYELFRAFDSTNVSAQNNFVEIYINQQYHGLYLLTQRVDKQLLNLNKNDSTSVLFKDIYFGYNPDEFENKRLALINYYNKDKRYKNYSKKAKDKLCRTAFFNQRFPKMERKDKTQIIYDLANFIWKSPDSIFNSKVDSFFDLNNVIDWHLLLLLTNNSDGILKNYYLYKQNSQEKYKIAPWDYDHGFGRDGDGFLNPNHFLNPNRSSFFKRLLETNACDYKNRLKNRYKYLKTKEILSVENLHNQIDKEVKTLKFYAEKNHQKWGMKPQKYFKNCDFDSEIKFLKNWIQLRFIKIETYLEDLDS